MNENNNLNDDLFFLHAITPFQDDADEKLKFGIYVRGISEDALHVELEALEAVIPTAMDRTGLDCQIVGTYRDIQPSSNTSEHLGLKRLLRDIDAMRLNAVVVTSLDHLTRGVPDAQSLLTHLQMRGVSLLMRNNPIAEMTRCYSNDSSLNQFPDANSLSEQQAY